MRPWREELTADPRFIRLMVLVKENLARMNSQGLANVAWACARLEHSPGVDVLRDIAAGLAKELTAQSAAQANGGGGGGGGGRKANSREVRPQAISNTLWAGAYTRPLFGST